MSELASALLAFPTVVFTIPLGLSLVYWLFVIIGAADIDMLDSADGALDAGADAGLDAALDAGVDAHVDAAADGFFDAADGMLDGGADGALAAHAGLDGGADGALDGAHEAAADALDGGVEGLHAEGLSIINLRRAPVTVVFSLISFFGWFLCALMMINVAPRVPVLPAVATHSLILVTSFLASLVLTSQATRPLEKVFKTKSATRNTEVIGQVCRIRTGSVDARFGQATLEDGGAGLLLQVRDEGSTLKRGDRALIVDYDQERHAYIVAAYDELLEEEAAERAARR